MDAIGPRMRIYNVCRARAGWNDKKNCQCSCGLSYPAKMWTQPDKTRWKFICRVAWKPLVIEARKSPNDTQLQQWVNNMAKKYGTYFGTWPQLGCGSVFAPWKRETQWW